MLSSAAGSRYSWVMPIPIRSSRPMALSAMLAGFPALGVATLMLAAEARVVVPLNGRQVTVTSRVVDAPGIVEIMQQVGSLAIPLARPARGGNTARCEISGDVSDQRVAWLELYCDGWRVEFVRLCAPRPCRYQTASQMYLPRPTKP